MPLELSPLDEAALSPAIRKVASAAAPPPLKLMVARGMAPLPPQDLAVALYQLWATARDSEASLKETADKTARELPDSVLAPALGAPLDARVLDFLARALAHRHTTPNGVLGPLLLNNAVSDETFAWLAAAGGDALVEQIGQNEQRLLRHPAIITSLYLNPRARMSTAQRAMELAVRNGVTVEGVPGFEDIKAAIEQEGGAIDEAADAAFAGMIAAAKLEAAHGADGTAAPVEGESIEERLAAEAEEADKKAQAVANEGKIENAVQVSRLSMGAKLRLAALGNAFVRAILVRDTNRVIAMAAVRHPGVNEHEAERFAANRALHEDVIRYLATNRQFTKRYSVKFNLVNNPKCPLQVAIIFLGHLTARDLRTVAKSKGIPSALAKAAQGLIAKREAR